MADRTHSNSYRAVTAAIGLVFMAGAVALFVVSDRSIGPVLVAIVMGALGAEAIASAWRNKISLLARIGPMF